MKESGTQILHELLQHLQNQNAYPEKSLPQLEHIFNSFLANISAETSIESKLVALVDSMPDPFVVVESDGNMQRVNKQAELLFGYNRLELIGKPIKMLMPERLRHLYDAHLANYLLEPGFGKVVRSLDLSCLTSTGEEIPVLIAFSPVIIHDETRIIVRFLDTRNEHGEQAQLQQALQNAEAANRTMSRFLSMYRHNLSQPLQLISKNLDLLAKTLDARGTKPEITRIRMALDNADRLQNSLRILTRLEAGKVQPELATIYIREVLERVHKAVSQQAQAKFLRFSVCMSSLAVTSDSALLELLLTNLAENAIRYTPDNGHLLLGCRRLPTHIRIEVIDNGPGIAAEELDLVLDEYWQLQSSPLDEFEGFGLDLFIVKLLAEMLNLKLTARSIPGRGSCFSVLVPLATDLPESP